MKTGGVGWLCKANFLTVQAISRLSDSLWIYLFAFYVGKVIGTKRHCIDLFTLCASLSSLHQLSSPQLLVLTAMSRVSLSGTYANFPAKIFIDPSKPESVLSTQFSCYHNVPRNVTSICGVAHVACSALVIVPTDGRLPFQVKYSPQADVLLGADWIVACQPKFVDGGIHQP